MNYIKIKILLSPFEKGVDLATTHYLPVGKFTIHVNKQYVRFVLIGVTDHSYDIDIPQFNILVNSGALNVSNKDDL
jgi:hypothetical protein